MKKHWWKALGVVIVLYVLIVGMLTPLHSGIEEVSKQRARAGDTLTIEVLGYNTLFAAPNARVRVWLSIDSSHAIAAATVKPTDDQHLSATFYIPKTLPSDEKITFATLVIDNATQGNCLLPNAVTLTRDTMSHDTILTGYSQISQLTHTSGLTFPFRNILAETIRNTYFHVALWLAMFILLATSSITAILFLHKGKRRHDQMSVALAELGTLYGILGLVTGAIWAKYTWGSYWSFDIKQNMAAVAMLIYFAYFVLRSSFDDPEKEARIAAVFNIFAFVSLIPLLFVIPRMWDSLHPGNGGNPALGSDDLDNTMRLVFYPAVIGWTLIAVWMSWLRYRILRLEYYAASEFH